VTAPTIHAGSDQAPVAVMRRGLGAQQTRSVEHFGLETILDLPFRHQRHEPRLVSPPVSLFSFL
jgi:hypothetical protein